MGRELVIATLATLLASGLAALARVVWDRWQYGEDPSFRSTRRLAWQPIFSREGLTRLAYCGAFSLLGAYLSRNIVSHGAAGHTLFDGEGPAYVFENGMLLTFYMWAISALFQSAQAKRSAATESQYAGFASAYVNFLFMVTFFGSIIHSLFEMPPLTNRYVGAVIGGIMCCCAFLSTPLMQSCLAEEELESSSEDEVSTNQGDAAEE